MHILIVAEYGILNGGERSLLCVLPALQSRGYQFSALLPADSEFANALRSLNVRTFPLKKFNEQQRRLDQTEIRQQLANCFQSERPEAIHCNSLATSRWCGPVAAALGIPAIGYLRDIINISARAVTDINQLSRLVAVSHATRDWHLRNGLDASKTEVIYNGIDLEKFSPKSLTPSTAPSAKKGSIRSELQLPPATKLILFVGQIGMRKGVDLLLESFQQIMNKQMDCHLLVVGERNSEKQEAVDFENEQRARAEQDSLNQRVHWLGRRTDVAELMRQSSVLLHPARQEPLGRVLLEAAASGLPIVTTAVGGSAEILSGLERWELLQPLEPLAIAERVVSLLHDDDRRIALGHQLRQIAKDRFSIEHCAAQLDRLYAELNPAI